MAKLKPYSINVGGRLVEISRPMVMGILNVTPDSFYAESRCGIDEEAIAARVSAMVSEGVDMIDVGGYSSRPGADEVSAEEELCRLRTGISVVRRLAPGMVISVDTFRADVARRCIEDFGAHIINDISGGDLDPEMFETVASLKVPYVLMHMRGTPATMSGLTDYGDVTADVIGQLASKVSRLRLLGVNDVIVDPGFGFSKTMEQNYELMRNLEVFAALDAPLLVGVSRKSMIYRLLGITPEAALNATTALHAMALSKGAHILRVHDVAQAVEAVKIVGAVTGEYDMTCK